MENFLRYAATRVILPVIFITLLLTSFSVDPPLPAVKQKAQTLFRWVFGFSTVEQRRTSLGPNVTKCQASFSDADAPVNCCAGVPSFTEEELLATAVDFKFPEFNSSNIRVRRPVHTIKDQDYIARYRRATEYLKNLPLNHPHNFARQANMHCMYCTGAYDQVNYDMVLKIHRTRLFFPWHRAYLYFHERILAKVMGEEDDNFAVPYWNWDVPEGMYMPEMFMEGSLYHFNREETHFPPLVTQNDFYRTDNNLTSEERVEANLALMYVQMVSGARSTELFMGCPVKPGPAGWCMGLGTLEMYPHNSIHSWTGKLANPEREDMGAFYSAARDPLFYSHHANIDRLWDVWRDLYDYKLEWDDPDWFESFFYFYDENMQLVRVKVSDMLDRTKLGYRYVESPTPWLNHRPKPLVKPRLAKKALAKKTDTGYVGLGGRTLDSTFTVRVPRTVTVGKEMRRKEKEEVEEMIVVYGIDAGDDVAVRFDVFVNMIDEATAIASDARVREYAGSFLTMRSGKRLDTATKIEGSTKLKTTFKIGISEILEDLEAVDDDSIWVTVVPRGGVTGVSIEGIKIEKSKRR
ncbi:Catechol oxidase [Zostera marina]|uniref:Catechol oxidase n=1 Tax=Zostera marina TaxID=29655 RepID=A0A0K9Q3U4_ZOSMR|nr:Catechol oxidase [Zostera marina]